MPKQIVLNNWEYLKLKETHIPPAIRNASDPTVIDSFLQEKDADLTELEKQYLQHKKASIAKISEKIRDVQKRVSEGTYQKQITPLESAQEGEQVSYQLPQIHLPAYQSAKNGCWSCFYQMALQSRGITDLSQEDIRAFRPASPNEGFIEDGDVEMNSDVPQNIVDMGDLALNLMPDTMIKSTELWSLRKILGADPFEEEKGPYFQRALDTVKKQITEAIRDHHSPVGLMMDGHYITIVGISGDKISYKNSMPSSKNENSADETITEDLSTLLGPALNGVNADAITLTWLEDMVLSKEENRLYRTANPNTRVGEDGQVIVEAKEDQFIFNLDDRHQDGMVIARSGDADLSEADSELRTNRQITPGAFCVHKTYLPRKVNLPLLKTAAENRENEKEETYKAQRQKELDAQQKALEKVPKLKEDLKTLEAAAGPQANPEEGYKIPVQYTGRPFYGGGNFVDFKNLMNGVGWDKNDHELLLKAMANVYDVFDVPEGSDQKIAMDGVFSNLAQFEVNNATVAAVFKQLSGFLNEIKKGTGRYIDEFGNPVHLEGTDSLDEDALTIGQSKALHYLDAYVTVLYEMAKRAPQLEFSKLNPNQFIDANGNIKEQELKENRILVEMEQAAGRTKKDRGIWSYDSRKNVWLGRESVPGRNFLEEAAPGEREIPKYVRARGEKLAFGPGLSQIMFTGFYNDLQAREMPMMTSNEDQNMLRAIFNFVAIGQPQYEKVYNHFIDRHWKLNETDFTDLLLTFHDMNLQNPNLPETLRESALCISQVLGVREERLLISLENAFNKKEANAFVTQLMLWEKTEQMSIAKRGYPLHFSDRVRDALKMIKREMATAKEGDPHYDFYRQVREELGKLPEGQVFLATLEDLNREEKKILPSTGRIWTTEKIILDSLKNKKEVLAAKLGANAMNGEDPDQLEAAAGLVVCGMLESLSAKKTFFGHTAAMAEENPGDRIRTNETGMLSEADARRNAQMMLEEILSQPQILKNAMANAQSPQKLYECYRDLIKRSLTAEVQGAQRAEEAEKKRGRREAGNRETVQLSEKDELFLKQTKLALKKLYSFDGKFRSSYMERLCKQLDTVIKKSARNNRRVDKKQLESLRNKALVYFDRRKGLLMGPITDKGKMRLEIVENLAMRLDKVVKQPEIRRDPGHGKNL